MIATVQLADIGARAGLRLSRTRLDPAATPGLRHAELTTGAHLSGHLLPRPNPGRVGLIAVWEEEAAFERFLERDPVASALADGWRVRLQPTHVYGAWPQVDDLLERELPMEETEPAAVLTIGRLRLSQTVRFLRASAAAEELAVRDPALLAATGLARAPALVATFSLWRSTAAMRAYAGGKAEPQHRVAVRAHAERPFHHYSAFIRFRPYGAQGLWDGIEPLSAADGSRDTHGQPVAPAA